MIDSQLEGRFKLVITNPETQETRETDWFSNLILNQGLNAMATENILIACSVGTSNVAPNVNQTSLVNAVATTANPGIEGAGVGPAPAYRAYVRKKYRFDIGQAAGNLSEVGISGPTTLFSRALIVDNVGNPTTITVLPTEILDVYYELGIYPKITDTISQISIGGVLRTLTVRPADVDDWASPASPPNFPVNSGATVWLSSQMIQPITSRPSQDITGATTPLSYENNSYRQDFDIVWGLGSPSVSNSLFIVVRFGLYQIGISPPISKNDTQVLTLRLRVSWSRYVP